MKKTHLCSVRIGIAAMLTALAGLRGGALPAGAANDAPAFVPLTKGAPTFNKDIAPIVYDNCSSCHHPGEVAPFSLMTYQDVQKRAKQIALVTSDHVMPPWKADEGQEKFHDARLLSAGQINTIKQWTDAGTPEGNVADLPAAPKFNSDWHLGEPDAAFEPTASYTLAAEGDDIYRCFVLPTNYDADRWISAMEVRPGNRTVVHHVLVFLDTSGKARQKEQQKNAADTQPGYTSGGGPGFMPSGYLGAWAPGNEQRRLPDGIGFRLPKGADIVLQVHYHRSGKAEIDHTKIALYFSQKPVDKEMHVLPLLPFGLNIDAGDKNSEATAQFPALFDATLWHVSPHMHLLGHDMTVSATLPDGTEKKLVTVPDWDFNWQTTYAFQEPVKLPRGSMVKLRAHFDNSTDNPRNPNNPPRPVKWGERTSDEMCIAFLDFTVDSEHLAK